MPQSNHYVICPYFKNEFNKCISCEDVRRSFCSHSEKHMWMKMYCDSWEWEKCPYAVDMAEAYYRHERGDDKALENEKIKALEKENRGLSTKLGRAEKQIERMKKKIDELRAVNQSFIGKNDEMERQKKHYYDKWRAAQEELDKGDEDIQAELSKLGGIYEQRMCYLIDNYAPDGIVYEKDIEEWAADRAFCLMHEYIDVNDLDKRRTGLVWKVVFEEDGKHESEGISEDDRNKA